MPSATLRVGPAAAEMRTRSVQDGIPTRTTNCTGWAFKLLPGQDFQAWCRPFFGPPTLSWGGTSISGEESE